MKTAVSLCALVMMAFPLLSAESILLVEQETGIVFESDHADEVRPVASLTKIAACLVALEWIGDAGAGLDLDIAVPAAAVKGGANPLALKAGDRITLETALTSAMMASDNTATHAMAEALGKQMDPAAESGVPIFVKRMNELAGRLGMPHTRFINPHGLDEADQTGLSTASDLGRLVLFAYDEGTLPQFASVRTRDLKVLRDGKERVVTIRNTNELVESRGIDGLKTGTTRLAGSCLVVSATRQTGEGPDAKVRRLHAILLGSEDRFRDAVLLLDRGWKRLETDALEEPPSDPNLRLRKGRD